MAFGKAKTTREPTVDYSSLRPSSHAVSLETTLAKRKELADQKERAAAEKARGSIRWFQLSGTNGRGFFHK